MTRPIKGTTVSDSPMMHFGRHAHAKLGDYLAQITRCAELLDESQFWHRANANCNSVGILVLHLTGNVRQWILGGLGGESIQRDRPAEFHPANPPSIRHAIGDLTETVEAARHLIATIKSNRWDEPARIQGYSTTVLGAVLHVVEHFAFHAGQIVHITKALRNVDLSLYDAHGRRRDARMNDAP